MHLCIFYSYDSMFLCGEYGKEVKKRVQADWNVMCDESFSTNERKSVQDGGETCDVYGLEQRFPTTGPRTSTGPRIILFRAAKNE